MAPQFLTENLRIHRAASAFGATAVPPRAVAPAFPRMREDLEYEHPETGGGLTPEPQSEKLAKKATMHREMIGRQQI